MHKITADLPILLAIILYLLIFWVRSIQGGWDLRIDVFKVQRDYLDAKISQFLPSPQAELLSGILLGQNKNLPSNLKLALRDTSTLHIVVASGQNLSMAGGFFLALSGLIKKRNAVFLTLLAVFFYTLLTGFQIPIIRAAIMFTLASLAQLFGRQRDGVWILIITASLMLLINPAWILEISFQLSVLATFGVVSAAPILLRFLNKIPIIGQDLAVSLGAQAMVAPIIAQNFHQFSLVGLLTNILILWTIPFIMIGGVVMLLAGIISAGLGNLAGLLVSTLLTYFVYIVSFFASLPFAWEYIGEKALVVWVGYYLLVGGIVLLLTYGQTKNPGRFNS